MRKSAHLLRPLPAPSGSPLKYMGHCGPVVLSAGLLESSMRLKPHEAQSYRKKALWVSLVSIVVTIVLAITAFSE